MTAVGADRPAVTIFCGLDLDKVRVFNKNIFPLIAASVFMVSCGSDSSSSRSQASSETTSISEVTTVSAESNNSAAESSDPTADSSHRADPPPLPDGLPLSKEEIYDFFSRSAFVGTSIGRDRKQYYDSFGEDYLGSPVMLVKGSYAFYSDEGRRGADLQVEYNGTPAPARECIKKCGAKYVFLNVGVNDIFHSDKWEPVVDEYKRYIQGIRDLSPDTVIFIESLTPICEQGQIALLTNETLDKFNACMKEYAESQNDMYYIDVSTPLKNDRGALKDEYSRDNYIHLTDEAYRIWTETVIRFVCDYMESQK